MKKIVIGIIILTLSACKLIGTGNEIEFTIENKSDAPIENVRFTTSENLTELKFDNIGPNGIASGFLNMQANKSDGTYILEYTRNGKKETKNYGHYTNGAAINQWVEFEIENDTVNQKFGDL